MIKDAIIRIYLSSCDEVPSLRSDSGKLDPISFGRITLLGERAEPGREPILDENSVLTRLRAMH
jgi:hypothetical protein